MGYNRLYIGDYLNHSNNQARMLWPTTWILQHIFKNMQGVFRALQVIGRLHHIHQNRFIYFLYNYYHLLKAFLRMPINSKRFFHCSSQGDFFHISSDKHRALYGSLPELWYGTLEQLVFFTTHCWKSNDTIGRRRRSVTLTTVQM